jgi:hypothetical protein
MIARLVLEYDFFVNFKPNILSRYPFPCQLIFKSIIIY